MANDKKVKFLSFLLNLQLTKKRILICGYLQLQY